MIDRNKSSTTSSGSGSVKKKEKQKEELKIKMKELKDNPKNIFNSYCVDTPTETTCNDPTLGTCDITTADDTTTGLGTGFG